jgi:SRSO17 transposase
MQEFTLDSEGQRRLGDYFDMIGRVLGSDERRASFAVYAQGLLGEGSRKSMEPMAARACPDPERVDAQHQRLQHFVTDSRWSDREVRKQAALYALSSMTCHESVMSWILDDTGFLKQGRHSVGVKRQYTGSAGKVANCQVGVSLTIATSTQHVPIDFELYLPRDWAEDVIRRAEAHIPDEVIFMTKPELGLKMVERALEHGIPPGRVLADTSYGTSSKFRRALRRHDLPYGVAVSSTTKVWQLDSLDRRRGTKTLSVAEYAKQIVEENGFRRTTWRQGTKAPLSARFAAQRVLPIADEGIARAEREVVWLLMEWENGEAQPGKYYFITGRRHMRRRALVRQVKQRWRTERTYEDLKGQLGIDHFEGRRFPGWHHHISVALCSFAFIVAERARLFPPQARRAHRDDPNGFATRAPLCRLDHHGPARRQSRHRSVAAALP